MTNENLSEWLKQTRKRLRMTQSAVAAYILVKTRKDCNQGRVSEMERGLRPITSSQARILANLFRQVEELRKEKRHWSDVFFI